MMHLLELQLKIISHVPRVCLYSASSENYHKAFPISAMSHPHSSSINRLNHQKLYLSIFILSNKTWKEIFNLFFLHKVSKEFDNNRLVLKWAKIMSGTKIQKGISFSTRKDVKSWGGLYIHLKCLPIYNQEDRSQDCIFVPLLQSLMQCGTLQEIMSKISTIHFQILSRTSIKLRLQTWA